MKKIMKATSLLALMLMLSGCIVAPPPYHGGGYHGGGYHDGYHHAGGPRRGR